jgi:mRNA interferase RelE/StbE
MYKVKWENNTEKELYNIPHFEKLLKKVDAYLARSPKELGKPLSGEYKGLYRYRYGDYRIIYQIYEADKQVIILKVGHRREVYE